jgi:hypothetical protein
VGLTSQPGKEEWSGSAFEYALFAAIARRIRVTPLEDEALERARKKYEGSSQRSHLLRCAERAVQYLLRADKRLESKEPKTLSLNSSRAAQSQHDVRDIVLEGNSATIGFSCKVNNQDLRHSRLARKLDFIKEWDLDENGASPAYWKGVSPVFDRLHELRERGLDWVDEYPTLATRRRLVLAPVLDAWESEMRRVVNVDSSVPERLCRYLLGSKSYWKVVSGRRAVLVQKFNLEGDMPGEKLTMPGSILGISIRDTSSVRERIVTCDEGYAFGFRLHTASSHIESSLKFAVKGLKLPLEISTEKFPIKGR